MFHLDLQSNTFWYLCNSVDGERIDGDGERMCVIRLDWNSGVDGKWMCVIRLD